MVCSGVGPGARVGQGEMVGVGVCGPCGGMVGLGITVGAGIGVPVGCGRRVTVGLGGSPPVGVGSGSVGRRRVCVGITLGVVLGMGVG